MKMAAPLEVPQKQKEVIEFFGTKEENSCKH